MFQLSGRSSRAKNTMDVCQTFSRCSRAQGHSVPSIFGAESSVAFWDFFFSFLYKRREVLRSILRHCSLYLRKKFHLDCSECTWYVLTLKGKKGFFSYQVFDYCTNSFKATEKEQFWFNGWNIASTYSHYENSLIALGEMEIFIFGVKSSYQW